MNAWRKSAQMVAAATVIFSGGTAAETAFIHFEDLPVGYNVGGANILHPFITIENLHGTDSMLVVETGNDSTSPVAYGSPNPVWYYTYAANNCLEDEYGLRVDMFDPNNDRTARGFSDIESWNSDTAQEFAVTFEGRRVKSLSVLMTDFGDFNSQLATKHQVGLWAFRDGVTVDTHVLTYTSEAAANPRNSPEMGDLYYTGDACVCDEGAVGHIHLKVEVGSSEPGFDRVELRAPLGWDPHVAFDSIYLVFEDTEFAGCTPGYWKQKQHIDSWETTGYEPTDGYESVFGVDASFDTDGTVTLVQAAALGGGGEKALARHAVAALLNAASGDVLYPFSGAEVIEAVQAAYAAGDFEGVKDEFEAANEQDCPLD